MFSLSLSLFFGRSSCLIRTNPPQKREAAKNRNPKRSVTSVMAFVRWFANASEATRDGGASGEEGYKCFWRRSQKAIDPGCYCLLQDLCGSRVASVFLASDQIRGARGQSLRRGAADDGVGARRADCRRFSPPPLSSRYSHQPPNAPFHHSPQPPPPPFPNCVHLGSGRDARWRRLFLLPGFLHFPMHVFLPASGDGGGGGGDGGVGRERKMRKKSRTPKFRY